MKEKDRRAKLRGWFFSTVIRALIGHDKFKGWSAPNMADYLKERFNDNKSTTTLSDNEYVDYAKEIQQWASLELGLAIPDPDGDVGPTEEPA